MFIRSLISFPEPPLKESLKLPAKNSIYGYSIILKYSVYNEENNNFKPVNYSAKSTKIKLCTINKHSI
jgi:hypothetical protein